ncbi:uncharacterized protein LOC110033056 [Phalaenopsis equestris]|uniref:uncharacterized protein LOC110033056 n=1 Tax=Phalaenopsis equestris TaxID=78828 RepID=UPI0009E288BD|nr:uncharacterized protein LOC110033056 [Phalaenopsis equestris]
MIDLEAKLDFEFHDKENEVFLGLGAPLQKDKGMVGSEPALLSDQVSSSTVVNEMHHTPSTVHLGERQEGRLQDQKPAISFDGILQDKPVLIDLNLPLENECSLALNDPAEDINLKLFSSVAHDGILEHNQSNQGEASFIPEPLSSYSITKAKSDNQADCLSCHGQGSKPSRSPEFELILDATKDKGDTDIKLSSNKLMAFSFQVQVDFCGKPAKGSTNNRAFITVNDVSLSSISSCDQAKLDLDFSSDKLLSAVRSDNKRQDSNITFSNITNLPQPLIRDLVNELYYDGSVEDTLSSHAFAQDVAQRYALSRKFPTGCNSASKTRNTMSMSQDKIVEEPDTLSKTDDSVTTQLNSAQNDGSSMEKLSIEQDFTIAAAAEVLMGLSSERPSFPIDHQREVDCNSGNNQPLHSSDSFESEALQLSEVQTEHRLSISEPLNRTERERNVNGLRLRRGKGLRDFQKEILPGLASLARHEICEDMHNIGHKLRRTASRNARVNWFVAVQGRRSRPCSGLQRN